MPLVSRTDEQRGYDQRQVGQAPGDRPAPYSYADLQERLERLPRGHPSSNYHADGSRKPPPLRLRDLELPLPGDNPIDDGSRGDGAVASQPTPHDRSGASPVEEPLTEAEHADHVRRVQQRLDWARREGLATDRQYQDQTTGVWAKERRDIHDGLVDTLYSRGAGVPCDRQAVIAGGLGGAGKSTVLASDAGVDKQAYLTINPDDIKELMAERGLIPDVGGLSPMEASDLVHEESSHVAKLLAGRALADGKNVIWDITMSSRESVEARLHDLGEASYATRAIFVDIPVEVSVQRAGDRHRHGQEEYREGTGPGGRYVPADVIRSQADPQWGSANRHTFEDVKGRFDAWAVYDNSVTGRAPRLVASSDATGPGTKERA
jgi:predicted kinase